MRPHRINFLTQGQHRAPGCRRLVLLLGTIGLAVLCWTSTVRAQLPSLASEIGFDQQVGGQVPLDLTFRNEAGETVRLQDYFLEKPVIITPVYFQCPMLCTLELNGLVRTLRALKLDVGKDFDILTISIDPKEEPPLARQKREQYLAQYGRAGGEQGWHFLTGNQPEIDRLTKAVGFRSKYDPPSGQYAHAAGIVICTPEGRISRYLFGVEFVTRDLRLAVVESSQGRIGSITDQAMLFCYMYDPTRGKYGLAILNMVRLGGVLTLSALVTAIAWMLRNERARQSRPEQVLGGDHG